jgi:hypothetical protein
MQIFKFSIFCFWVIAVILKLIFSWKEIPWETVISGTLIVILAAALAAGVVWVLILIYKLLEKHYQALAGPYIFSLIILLFAGIFYAMSQPGAFDSPCR